MDALPFAPTVTVAPEPVRTNIILRSWFPMEKEGRVNQLLFAKVTNLRATTEIVQTSFRHKGYEAGYSRQTYMTKESGRGRTRPRMK